MLHRKRLAGVDADPYLQAALGERILRLPCGRHRIRGRRKRRKEGVPLSAQLDAAVGLEGRPQRAPMLDESLVKTLLPEFLGKPGRPFDVGEEEGDGPAG